MQGRLRITILAALSVLTAACAQAATVKLKVATFDVMSAARADSIAPWQARSTKICMRIHALAPDIIGLQGVTPLQYTDLSQGLPEYEACCLPTNLMDTITGSVPIFYRKDRVKLLHKGWFWLSETPDVPSASWGNSRPYAVSWVVMEDVKTGAGFILANAMLDDSETLSHLNSAILIKTYLSKMSNGAQVILVGDLNFTAADISYSALLTRIFPMQDAWAVADTQEGIANTYNGLGNYKEKRKVDYIFTTTAVKSKKATIETSAESDGSYLSDHNMLWAELSWKYKTLQ